MQTTSATLGDASALRVTIPKGEMVLWRTTVLVRTDDHCEQSIMLDEVTSLESAHNDVSLDLLVLHLLPESDAPHR